MYRYSVDNAVTYTSEDVVLFRESPFASWMERFTLENPDHGIPPDPGSTAPVSPVLRQDDIADMLRAEGRAVTLVDWEQEEVLRRAATLDAMRAGADFIVNGQVALGPLSGPANLLMRTSGYSDLGGYLYIPCDTQAQTTIHSTFRLCFLADLLHSLQGQLPPQMLIIRGGTDILPLQTEDHIYCYRAVKQRFMESMRAFRKHRMPDPAESSRFARWSDCANEVLRQRAEREEGAEDAVAVPLVELAPQRQMVVGAGDEEVSPYDLDDSHSAVSMPVAALDASPGDGDPGAGQTLAEQALKLVPGAYARESDRSKPGSTPNLAWVSGQPSHSLQIESESMAEPESSEDWNGNERRAANRRDRREPAGDDQQGPDLALQNLQFIGRDTRASLGAQASSATPEPVDNARPAAQAPAADTRETRQPAPASTPTAPPARLTPHSFDSASVDPATRSVIDMDMDSVPRSSPAAVLDTAGGNSVSAEPAPQSAGSAKVNVSAPGASEESQVDQDAAVSLGTFSNSLITNEHYQN